VQANIPGKGRAGGLRREAQYSSMKSGERTLVAATYFRQVF